MLWTILVASFIRNGCVTILLQASKVDHLTAKYFNWQSFIFSSNLFSSHTLWAPMNGLVVCGLIYLVYLFLSYLSHALLDFSETWATLFLMHTLATSTAIFRHILLCSITPQHILHNWIKYSITHNSTVILCSNFNGRLVY